MGGFSLFRVSFGKGIVFALTAWRFSEQFVESNRTGEGVWMASWIGVTRTGLARVRILGSTRTYSWDITVGCECGCECECECAYMEGGHLN